MEQENIIIKMVKGMKENGKMIKRMEKEHIIMEMVIYIMEVGKKA